MQLKLTVFPYVLWNLSKYWHIHTGTWSHMTTLSTYIALPSSSFRFCFFKKYKRRSHPTIAMDKSFSDLPDRIWSHEARRCLFSGDLLVCQQPGPQRSSYMHSEEAEPGMIHFDHSPCGNGSRRKCSRGAELEGHVLASLYLLL